jgi:uncharacterized protein (TIGR00297 family)
MILGVAIIIILGLLAYRLRSIDRSGLIAGIIIGTIVLAGGGWSWLIIIMSFFTISAISTHLKYEYKRKMGFSQEKGGARGWRNTVANGSIAACTSFVALYSSNPLLTAAFIGSVATSTADTLSTEIGLLSRRRPRLITTFRKVGAGTSGGVSLLGEIMLIGGSIMIGGLSFLLNVSTVSLTWIITISLISGLIGSTVDSLLGATVQGMYRCVVCGTVTETNIHHERPAAKIKGLALIENNIVNLISTGVGALVAIILATLL